MPQVALRHLLIPVFVVLLCATATAQPPVEVYWDDNNRADTLMDFGVTLEGYPVMLPFYVRNMGAKEVGILFTNPQADPYFQIVNTPDVSPSNPRKEEFDGVESLPYRIAPFSTDTFHIVYKAFQNNPVFPPDVVTKALLEVRVVSMQDTLGAAVFKRFLMVGLKTKYSVATNKPVIRFDSVYVDPTPQPPSESYAAINASSISIPVEQQKLVYMTSIVGDQEIIVDTLSSPVFAPHKGLVWNVRYKPHNIGFDSAQFRVVYRPNQGSAIDSVVTRLSGTGVRQELTIDGANGQPPPIVIRPGALADTVDFGDVDADGSGGKVARIMLKNMGNTHVRYVRESEVGTPNDTTAYIVQQSLMARGLDLRTNEVDTLVVQFKPVIGGLHLVNYVIETDLLTRPIRGVPDGADRKVLVFRAFARKPQMAVSPQQVDFGSVVLLEDCPSATERTVLVRNVGNILLRIDSAMIQPYGTAVTINPSNPIPPIAVDDSQKLVLRYQPVQVETMRSELVLYTNAFGPPVRIPLSGSSIESDSISVRVPGVRAKPGTVLSVPVLVDSDRIALTQTSHMTVAFDPTLLRYRGTITGGTASEGSTFIVQSEQPRGVLNLQLHANGSFLPRTTFIVISFDTFLGQSAATELSIKDETTMFGNDGCANILHVHTTSGRFEIDSICGLEFKTATSGILYLDAWPNPVSSALVVDAHATTGEPVHLMLYDTFGSRMPEDIDATVGSIDMSAHPAGVYLLVATCGERTARRLVVKQ